MSEKRRPVSGKTGSVHRTGTGTKRTASGTTVKKRPAAGHTVKKSRKKRKQQMFDFETLVALVLILLVAVGAILLIINGVKNCNCGSEPKQVAYEVDADIKPRETATPEPTATAETVVAEATSDVTNPPSSLDQTLLADATATAAAVTQPPTEVKSSELRSARIRTVGDFVIADLIFKSAKRLGTESGTYEYDFSPMLSYIKSYMQNADLTVANVDGCLGGKECYKYGYSGYPQFNTPPHILYALKDAGVDMLTLANNHMLDGWFDGLQKTISNVESVGLWHIGANRSLEEKNTAYIQEVNGIKIGFMNYTVSLNSMDTQKSLDSRAMEYGVNAVKNSDCTAYAAKLREAGAEVIVCFMHWGTEYTNVPDSDQEYMANMLVKAGVDVIMGGHPHVVQPAKWLTGTNQFGEEQKTLCVYSIGNFLSDHRGDDTSGGVIFDFTIQELADGSFEITSPSYLTTWVWRTGSSEDTYNYYVLPSADYIKNRPGAMSNSDYELMLTNYNNVLAVMQKGVGNQIYE